jgi:DNA (cytosine-5)-methyltransferase 1
VSLDFVESFDFVDLFCGAGGSIDGLVAAGGRLVLGANHWDRAIETVSANHPDADYLQADINNYDMRRLPKAGVLWASVICTEMSPAGGNKKRRGQLQLEEHGHVPSAAYERTRACALDVVRATEVHRYDAVVVENVVEFARDWELYDWWVEGMCKLGYQVEVVNVSAAHVGDATNTPAPQWRDRIFIVFVRNGIPMPDFALRPRSWCSTCEEMVEGVQTWKRLDRRRVGKYAQQYVYTCPRRPCGGIVEPLVLPAAAAIDWSNIGTRIGDRPRPLAPATMRRIEAGLQMFAQPVVVAAAGNTYEAGTYRRAWPAMDAPLNTRQATGVDALACPPFVFQGAYGQHDGRSFPADAAPLHTVTATSHEGLVSPPLVVNSNHDDNRAFPADSAPLATRSTKIGEAVVIPFITELRGGHSVARSARDPLATITASGNHHGLTVPPGSFYMKNFTPRGNPGQMCKDVRTAPFGSITSVDHHALVVPYRRGRAKTTSEPLLTLGTRDSAGLCSVEAAAMDCYYRMLTPREHLRGQRFRDDYEVMGNLGEQTMQAGNAVPCNVAQWIGSKLAEALA